jgi:acetylglutamate kinase
MEGHRDRIVLKIGGNELDDAAFVSGLIDALRQLWGTHAVALVHGGGKMIASLQQRLCLEPRFVEGLRVTDDESLDVAEMVLSGWVNKRLVARLVSAGIPAMGLSGVDTGLIRVVKMAHQTHDLGWVGDIVETQPSEVESLLARGVTPVVSPISLGLDGHTYNVNADHAAAALACALSAKELVFVSNVPGVLLGWDGGAQSHPAEQGRESGECIPLLEPAQVESLIASGEIAGGMVPKVRSALSALERGVPRVRICDLDGLCVDGGTCFVGN